MPSIIANGGIIDFRLLPPDTYFYGLFADFVLIQSGNNSLVTHEGDDIIDARMTPAGVDQLAFMGAGNDRYFGGSSNETFFDGTGNDIARLGAGVDHAYIGYGNDYLDGGTGLGDRLSLDTLYSDDSVHSTNIFSGFTVDLAKTTPQNLGIFGWDTLIGFEHVMGSYGHDRIYGNQFANLMHGNAGNDVLDGRAHNDTLYGSEGGDLLIGGLGRDILDGGWGGEGVPRLDRFRYLSFADSSPNPALSDQIVLFDKGGTATDDRIDLSAIDANPLLPGNQAFLWRGPLGFTAFRGEVRVATVGADTYVYVDNDTDAAAEMLIIVKGVTGLIGADFFL